jgi:hypothetical protein
LGGAAVPVCLSVLLLAACGGSSDTDDATPLITLLTTTTDVPPTTAEGATDTTEATVDSTDAVTTAPETAPETTTAASTVPPATEAPTTTSADLETRFSLTTSGLGTTSFGAEPEGAIAYISAFFGQPTRDTGWVDPFTIGPCGGSELRQVNWGNLQLEFGDASNVTEGRRHFYAYTYGGEGSATAVPPGLATPEKITVGSTVGALLAAYPSAQLLTADEFSPDSFVINDDLRGVISGLTDNDVVELIVGGLPCEG